MSDRMKFIPELKEKIVSELVSQGVDRNIVVNSLGLWNNNEQPRTPTQKGCFKVFEQIQDNIRKGEFDNV